MLINVAMYIVIGFLNGFETVHINWGSPAMFLCMTIELFWIFSGYAAWKLGQFNKKYGRLPKGEEWLTLK